MTRCKPTFSDYLSSLSKRLSTVLSQRHILPFVNLFSSRMNKAEIQVCTTHWTLSNTQSINHAMYRNYCVIFIVTVFYTEYIQMYILNTCISSAIECKK
jgi:hypothetical protein